MRCLFLVLAITSTTAFAHQLHISNNTSTTFPTVIILDNYQRHTGAPLMAKKTITYELTSNNFVINLKGDSGFNMTIFRRFGDEYPTCTSSPVYSCTFNSPYSVNINYQIA